MVRVMDYSEFAGFHREEGDVVNEIERENIAARVPLIGPSLGRLLYMICRISGARHVLELGSAHGYSTIWLARAVGPGGKVQGTEFDPASAQIAEKNLRRAGVDGIASIWVGDAIAYVSELRESHDMIFLDLEKEDYSKVLDDCVRALRPGGVLVADNVAFESAGDFNERVTAHPMLDTVFFNGQFINHSPDEDAVSISLKRGG
jgi:predicted O-methyltransferase YrrM